VSLASKRFMLRRDPRALTSWRRFAREFGDSPRPPDGLVEYRGPTELWIPERPRFIYYFTKDAMFRWWFRVFDEDVPRDIGVVAHGSTPSSYTSKLILGMVKSAGIPLVLLGDLDPGDLTAFAALVSGGINLGQRPLAQVDVLYGGLDDPMLQLVRRHVGSRRFHSKCLLAMTTGEREHLAAIKPLCPPLRSLCGREGADILESGLKCEVEAVFAPYICQGAFLADVRRHLTVRLPARLGL
jgi:hypothetical protein